MSVSVVFWGLPNHLANMNGCFTLTKCGPTCAAKMTLRSVEEDLLISGTILKPVFFFQDGKWLSVFFVSRIFQGHELGI